MTESNTSNEAEKTKLFVGGLAHLPSANEESLEEYFSKWGKVQSFQLIKDTNTQKSKGFGFVTFETAEAANNCLNHSPHTIEGKNISVKPCKEKERHDRTAHHFGHSYNGRMSHGHHHGHHHHGPNTYRPIPNYGSYPMQQHVHHGNHYGPRLGPSYWVGNNGQHRGYGGGYGGQQLHNNQHDHPDNHSTKSSSSQHNTSGIGQRGQGPKERNGSGGENATPNRNDDDLQVFVGGLPHNAGEKDLSNHFSRFGIVEHVSVAKDKQGGEGHKGFAFVTFANKEDRDKSLDHTDHRIKNRSVKVEKKKPSGKKEQPRPSYNSSLKNHSNGSFSHSRSSNVKHDKPPNGRHSGPDQRVSQPEHNGIISPELNQPKVSYQQPITPSINAGHMVNPGQYHMMTHPMTHHNYHQHPQHLYGHPQQPVMYPAQPIFHQIPQMINPGHNMMSHSQDPNQVYHSYVMPQAVVQQPMMMHQQIQQGQVPNSQPPISQSPHPGQSGGYYINATPNQMIQMAQPTPQTAPPVLQATNSDQANQQPLHGTPGRSPTIQ